MKRKQPEVSVVKQSNYEFEPVKVAIGDGEGSQTDIYMFSVETLCAQLGVNYSTNFKVFTHFVCPGILRKAKETGEWTTGRGDSQFLSTNLAYLFLRWLAPEAARQFGATRSSLGMSDMDRVRFPPGQMMQPLGNQDEKQESPIKRVRVVEPASDQAKAAAHDDSAETESEKEEEEEEEEDSNEEKEDSNEDENKLPSVAPVKATPSVAPVKATPSVAPVKATPRKTKSLPLLRTIPVAFDKCVCRHTSTTKHTHRPHRVYNSEFASFLEAQCEFKPNDAKACVDGRTLFESYQAHVKQTSSNKAMGKKVFYAAFGDVCCRQVLRQRNVFYGVIGKNLTAGPAETRPAVPDHKTKVVMEVALFPVVLDTCVCSGHNKKNEHKHAPLPVTDAAFRTFLKNHCVFASAADEKAGIITRKFAIESSEFYEQYQRVASKPAIMSKISFFKLMNRIVCRQYRSSTKSTFLGVQVTTPTADSLSSTSSTTTSTPESSSSSAAAASSAASFSQMREQNQLLREQMALLKAQQDHDRLKHEVEMAKLRQAMEHKELARTIMLPSALASSSSSSASSSASSSSSAGISASLLRAAVVNKTPVNWAALSREQETSLRALECYAAVRFGAVRPLEGFTIEEYNWLHEKYMSGV